MSNAFLCLLNSCLANGFIIVLAYDSLLNDQGMPICSLDNLLETFEYKVNKFEKYVFQNTCLKGDLKD